MEASFSLVMAGLGSRSEQCLDSGYSFQQQTDSQLEKIREFFMCGVYEMRIFEFCFGQFFDFGFLLSVSPEAGCFEPFVSSELTRESLDKFYPRYPNEGLDHVVSQNPSCQVSLRTFQFYPVLIVDGAFSAEFSTNGHGPVCLTTRKFVESELNNVNSSLDFCYSHLCWSQQSNRVWAYATMIPAWLAVYSDTVACGFFKFDVNQITCVSLGNGCNRFVFFYKFAFSSEEGKKCTEHALINGRAKVMFNLDHDTLVDKWFLNSKILSGFD